MTATPYLVYFMLLELVLQYLRCDSIRASLFSSKSVSSQMTAVLLTLKFVRYLEGSEK